MLLYHNVAELRQIKGAEYWLCDPSAMQGTTSELRGSEGKLASTFNRPRETPECQGRGSSCAAYCGSPREDLRTGSGCRGSRVLNLPQHAVIQAGRRQLPAKARKIRGEMAFNRRGKAIAGLQLIVRGEHAGQGQLGIDDRRRDGLLRIKRGQAPRQIFQLPHVSRPAVALEPFHGILVELLVRQPFAFDHVEEVSDQIRHVLAALP